MSLLQPLPRAALVERLREGRRWDVAVIGGGATGLGVALDAAARGFSTVLVEARDFAQGTSSRATKLAHGGVRYLAQGDIGLVREALRERGAMLANAPHLAQRLPLVMPSYRWWETAFYGTGLKAYDALAGSRGIGDTEFLGARRTQQLVPGVQPRGLAGGVRYWDGQFDDARLAVALARTAAARGALVINRIAVTGLLREGGRVHGLRMHDREGGGTIDVQAGCVVNATGIWVDEVRDMDREPGAPPRAPIVAPSQGLHLVVARRFLPGDHAILVPRTGDGRVLFAVPWLGKTILGTTDTPRQHIESEPRPLPEEVEFILREAARYLATPPRRDDVLSAWVGMRPLVRPDDEDGGGTKQISREHTVIVGRSGLVTVTGGKWTTYRAMAEDVLDRAMTRGVLAHRPGGVTERLPLVGAAPGRPLTDPPGEHLYGSEAAALRALPGADRWLWRDGEGGLSEAMVRFAVRHEMARSVEDVLARRCRLLFLDAREAARQAAAVARILGEELGREVDTSEFEALAASYATLP
ncbi:MAG: glycerol-3-phosphate dehydrogenase/oxidase [Rubrivivax sp.]|nr:glycerol-3-phosphate dehydrogenase/oxidase [Rubrivivax sp.]